MTASRLESLMEVQNGLIQKQNSYLEVQNGLIQEQNQLLAVLAETIEAALVKQKRKHPKNPPRAELTQDDYDALDEEIDLEWWFRHYEEEPHPAKYMNREGVPFGREEATYLFRRLCELASVNIKVNEGTHVFAYLGKTYCKAEKNSVNCFACLPVK